MIKIRVEINRTEKWKIIEIKETKSWFFWEKFDKPLDRLVRKKEDTINIRSERAYITILKILKGIMRSYYENCANTFEYLDEMEKFLRRHRLLKLTQEEI